MFKDIQEVNGQIVRNHWIEWEHEGVSNYPKEIREITRLILAY